jgi:LAO/AO transport system kinase
MLSLGEHAAGFAPTGLELSAQTHHGVAELVTELTRHREWLIATAELDQRRLQRAETRLRTVLAELALRRTVDLEDGTAFFKAAAQIADGTLDVREAAGALLDRASTPPVAP